jgi:hypothetical protein
LGDLAIGCAYFHRMLHQEMTWKDIKAIGMSTLQLFNLVTLPENPSTNELWNCTLRTNKPLNTVVDSNLMSSRRAGESPYILPETAHSLAPTIFLEKSRRELGS